MPRKKLYASKQERSREASRRRRATERRMTEEQAERNRRLQEGRNRARTERERLAREAKRRAERAAAPSPSAAESIALYRSEKAKFEARNAEKHAELMASVRRALAKADADKQIKRGGRKPRLSVTRDPADALIYALGRPA